jgi:hypothetical protein
MFCRRRPGRSLKESAEMLPEMVWRGCSLLEAAAPEGEEKSQKGGMTFDKPPKRKSRPPVMPVPPESEWRTSKEATLWKSKITERVRCTPVSMYGSCGLSAPTPWAVEQ